MRVRKTPEQDLEETRAELADARTKAAKWNGRVEELEGEVTEKENMMILKAARSVATSPEGLRDLLNLIRANGPQTVTSPQPPVTARTRTESGKAPDAPPVERERKEDKPTADGEGQRNG